MGFYLRGINKFLLSSTTSVCFVSVFVQHLILMYGDVFRIFLQYNLAFSPAGFSNNPRLCVLQSGAQQGVWQIHPILFCQGKFNLINWNEFDLPSHSVALCPSRSHSLCLSDRRTPPWLQQRTSWENGAKDSKIVRDKNRHPSIHTSPGCLKWLGLPPQLKMSHIQCISVCYSSVLNTNTTSTFSLSFAL